MTTKYYRWKQCVGNVAEIRDKLLVSEEESTPWTNEPDFVKWHCYETGLLCIIRRNRSGTLCGYVCVEKTNAYYKYDPNGGYENRSKLPYLDAHGGITWGDYCFSYLETDDGKDFGVYHDDYFKHWIPNGKHWWLGFDCAHSGDFCPTDRSFSGYDPYNQYDGSQYRNLAYVRKQCESLATQLVAAELTPMFRLTYVIHRIREGIRELKWRVKGKIRQLKTTIKKLKEKVCQLKEKA